MLNLKEIFSEKVLHLMATTLLDSQARLARISGISQASINRILHKNQTPSVDVIDSIAKAFGFKNPAYIFFDKEEINLLDLWSNISNDDKISVLGHLEVLAKSASTQKFLGYSEKVIVDPARKANLLLAAAKKPKPLVANVKSKNPIAKKKLKRN